MALFGLFKSKQQREFDETFRKVQQFVLHLPLSQTQFAEGPERVHTRGVINGAIPRTMCIGIVCQ